MTGPTLDLAALRKKAERGYLTVKPDVILAVLALVEEQRREIERLLPYSDHLRTCAITGKRPPGVCTCGYLDALAGSPAENKEEA